MALSISRRDIDEANRYARDAMSRVSRDPGRYGGEGVGQRLTRTAEVALGAVGVGVLSGRFGPFNVNGTPVPMDLIAGVGLHLLSFMGLAGAASPHLSNVADGVLAGYLTKFGVGYGKVWAQKAGVPPQTVVGAAYGDRSLGAHGNLHSGLPKALGIPAFVGAEPLTSAELAAMAQAVR